MKKVVRTLFKIARRFYYRTSKLPHIPSSGVKWNAVSSPRMLMELLASGKPCMIARFGSVELACMANYLASKNGFSPLAYVRGEGDFAEWEDATIKSLCTNAGFFPRDLDLAAKFCELMMKCAPEVDILGSWLNYEKLVYPDNMPARVHLANLEPFDDSNNPWSKYLKGKKVLVVHPFAKLIEKQYEKKRQLLFSNPDVLPRFELFTVQAVQSMGGHAPTGLDTWFDALEHMKGQIDAVDYDVCLLGCGAYGFPLAAHVKKKGKQAIHMGGALQLLFGIKGKRWTEQYGKGGAHNPYLKLFNEHWVFPDLADKPACADKVEDACYW